MVWGKAGSTELSSSASSVSTGTFTASKFNVILQHYTQSSGDGDLRFNDNNNGVYAMRYSNSGTTDSTSTSDTKIFTGGWGSGKDVFAITYGCSISGEEKLIINFGTVGGTGAGTVHERRELVAKFVPSPDVDITSATTGARTSTLTLASGDNISALGSDMTPAAAVTFPSDVPDYTRFEETDTRKMYSLRPTLKLDEDFSSYATQVSADASWVSEDTAETRVNITDDDIDFTYGASTNTRISHDLQNELGSGVFLDTKFILRGKLRYSVLTSSAGNDRMFFGIGSGTGDKNEADSIQMEFRQYSSSYGALLRLAYGAGSLGSSTSITNLSTSTDYYWEIKRDELSVTITIYTDSSYSTVHGTVTGTISSQSNLRYVKLMSNTTSSQGAFTGTLDDVKVYNGVTDASTTTLWKEKGTT